MSNASSSKRSKVGKGDRSFDWAEFDALTDEEIEAAVRDDPDAPPIVDAEWFAGATLVLPKPKEQISIRLDADVVAWLKASGEGYQTRINTYLRQLMEQSRR